MITGSAPAAIHYVTKDGWITKSEGDLDVPIQLNITPLMTLEHNIAFFLNFGKICTSSLTQTITVSPSGSISSTNLYCGASGTSPDAFTVHGVTGASFVVNLPASASITNGENILTLSDFTSSCSSAPCSIESGFEQQFNVGATLTIPPGISLGHYVGSYMVSVTY